MLSFRIEERVTYKNCSVTGLKRGVEWKLAVGSSTVTVSACVIIQYSFYELLGALVAATVCYLGVNRNFIAGTQ